MIRALEAAGSEAVVLFKLFDQLFGFVHRPVGDGKRCDAGIQQRWNNAAGGATGTQDYDISVIQLELEIVRQIPDQARAISIVSHELTVVPPGQGVHRTRPCRPFRELRCQFRSRRLMRYGYIQTATTLLGEVSEKFSQFGRFDLIGLITDFFSGLSGKQAVDNR